MKKVLALVLALVMVLAVSSFGLAEGRSPETEADWALADKVREVYNNWEEGSDWTIAYICKSMAGSWFSTEFAAFEAKCKELGAAKVISYDCNKDGSMQLEYTNTAIAQGVDFIVFVPSDETVSTACVELCVEAGIPCCCEDDPLVGTDGDTRLTPSFQLDSYYVGQLIGSGLAQWALDNGVLTPDMDFSNVGLMDVDCTIVSSFSPRPIGIADGWLETIPNFPAENVFRPDTKSTGFEESYDAAAACLNAHPEIELWFLSGVNDECTCSALRAFEDLGKAENTYAAALGAYYADAEWDVYGEESPFVLGYYLSATADGQITAEAVMEYLKTGAIPFEEYIDNHDWPFGMYPYTGEYCDYSNYVDIITKIEGSYTPATETLAW